MVYSLTYRRPERAGSIRSDMSREEKAKSIRESIDSCNSAMSHGIPEALSFDRIIAGGACPVSCLHHVPAAIRLTNSTPALHGPRLYELPQIY
jgi:hypothetical protein